MVAIIGVENTKKLFSCTAKAVRLVKKVFEDGKVGIGDLFTILNGIGGLAGFASVNYLQLIPELKDLSKEEFIEIMDAMVKEIMS